MVTMQTRRVPPGTQHRSLFQRHLTAFIISQTAWRTSNKHKRMGVAVLNLRAVVSQNTAVSPHGDRDFGTLKRLISFIKTSPLLQLTQEAERDKDWERSESVQGISRFCQTR